MSRKKKLSKNWHKAKRRVQKIHTRISNARKDFLQKASTEISKNFRLVAVEDLQVGNMSKSSTCTADAPGKNVAAKFECVNCGHEENADVVGAMNVLARGHRVAACGEDGSGLARKRKTKPASLKQEPTEATIREVAHA